MGIFGLVSRKEHEQEINGIKKQLNEAVKATRWQSWQLQTAEAEKFNIPDPSIYGNQADLYRKLSWVMLAVDLTAKGGALTPFEVKRLISDKEPKDIPNHPFEQLLQRPNELDSRYEFLYGTIAFYALTGNAYWWLNRADEKSPPDEMWLIPSNMIQPVPDENMFIRGYLYSPGNGREILLPPREIMHFKRFNPASRFVGLSAIESIALVATGDLAMQKWNTELFGKNNARLPGILSFKDMVEDATWDKIKTDTREAAQKRELLMLRGAGDGVNWLQNAVSQREMEFLAGRKANKEEIMTAIAPGSFTMLSEDATQANSVVGRASFNELTIYPMQVMISEKITSGILPSYGGRTLIGCFEDVRVADKDLELRQQEAFERSHTVEEVRAEFYGDEPLGDERDNLFPSQITSASAKPEPPQPPQNPVNNAMPNDTMNQPAPDTQPQDTAMKADLSRWQRKALKKVGQFVPFESDAIPYDIRERIETNLAGCKTEMDVRRLFMNISETKKNEHLTIEAIRAALAFKVK